MREHIEDVCTVGQCDKDEFLHIHVAKWSSLCVVIQFPLTTSRHASDKDYSIDSLQTSISGGVYYDSAELLQVNLLHAVCSV